MAIVKICGHAIGYSLPQYLNEKKENAVADEKQKALQDSESCVPYLLYKSQEFMKGHSKSWIEVIEQLQQIKELQYVFHSVY